MKKFEQFIAENVKYDKKISINIEGQEYQLLEEIEPIDPFVFYTLLIEKKIVKEILYSKGYSFRIPADLILYVESLKIRKSSISSYRKLNRNHFKLNFDLNKNYSIEEILQLAEDISYNGVIEYDKVQNVEKERNFIKKYLSEKIKELKLTFPNIKTEILLDTIYIEKEKKWSFETTLQMYTYIDSNFSEFSKGFDDLGNIKLIYTGVKDIDL